MYIVSKLKAGKYVLTVALTCYRDRSANCWPCFLSTDSNTVCFYNNCVSLPSVSLFWTSSLPHEQQGTCQWCILSFYSRFTLAFIFCSTILIPETCKIFKQNTCVCESCDVLQCCDPESNVTDLRFIVIIFNYEWFILDINWILLILCIAFTAGFQVQNQIGNAYGEYVRNRFQPAEFAWFHQRSLGYQSKSVLICFTWDKLSQWCVF